MKNVIHGYRSGLLTKTMTEEEVLALAEASTDYFTGDLTGRRPPFSAALSGLELRLDYGVEGTIPHRFADDHTLVWTDGEGKAHEEYYEAFEIDRQLYLAAYLRKGSRPVTSCTVVLDLAMNLTTMIRSSMGTAVSARDIDQRVWHGVIRREGMMPPLAWRHHPTRDLVGLSTGWSYRDDMASQHIYGSPYGISWVILTGPGNGLLGSAPCKYFKIREHVYLYSWLETMGSGQQGVVLMNMKTMHDVGTFYGVNHAQRFEFYTYGAKGYILGRYNTRDKFL